MEVGAARRLAGSPKTAKVAASSAAADATASPRRVCVPLKHRFSYDPRQALCDRLTVGDQDVRPSGRDQLDYLAEPDAARATNASIVNKKPQVIYYWTRTVKRLIERTLGGRRR